MKSKNKTIKCWVVMNYKGELWEIGMKYIKLRGFKTKKMADKLYPNNKVIPVQIKILTEK